MISGGAVGMDLLWPSKKQESSKPSPQHKAVDRRELSPNELYAYTKDIELQLEQSEAKRADLLLELEAYTGASANLTWDSTALLQQRAIGAEVKLTRVEKAFSQLSVEHASLSDDFAKLKEAKRLSDQSGREVTLPSNPRLCQYLYLSISNLAIWPMEIAPRMGTLAGRIV